ncbi:ModE family transcriptional regulator [Acidocella aquatica]|uniref:ModE family transcriptional regulator n=1 Tax=Acidocella aquatica TaxID=1922313 RepID=A0ABQ6ABB1_9PROT|nr:LysR family transcriptional regulator [Acidocella aquatica]GLR68715.1 ModE family transcriptional regulator [Acidocella aquatica]
MATAPPLALRLRLQRNGAIILGPGRADLLAYIAETGSIAAAGRRMGMSYKRAWVLVDSLNATFHEPLVLATKGGAGGGGARLTPLGARLLAAYRGLEAATATAGAGHLMEIEAALAVPPAPKASYDAQNDQ